MQVQGQISLLCSGVLSFGLAHYASSDFELLAEELLMSDSVIKVSYMHLWLPNIAKTHTQLYVSAGIKENCMPFCGVPYRIQGMERREEEKGEYRITKKE